MKEQQVWKDKAAALKAKAEGGSGPPKKKKKTAKRAPDEEETDSDEDEPLGKVNVICSRNFALLLIVFSPGSYYLQTRKCY